MNKTVRTVLGLLGFLVAIGILMSDRFQSISDAIPESVYYYVFITTLALFIVIGLHAWWQHYNGRKLNPSAARFKKWMENPPWWLWPF